MLGDEMRSIMRYFTKHECLERAQELLARGDDDVLTYAALELRQAVEAIVYDKLNVYDKYVPRAVFETWQPYHAMRMLLEFEPDGDENMRMRIAETNADGTAGPWIDLGEHRTFKVGWLNKNYNKLGSYVHAPHGRDREVDFTKMRADLNDIVAEVRVVVESPIIGIAMAPRYSFPCGACGRTSVANATSVEGSGKAVCIHPNCGAIHRPRWEGETWKLVLETTEFDCCVCKGPIPVENRKLDIKCEFECPTCKTNHVVVGRQWAYATKKEAEKHGRC
jgi:hypothetical protein